MRNRFRYLYLVLHCILLLVGSYMVVTVPSTASFWPMPTKLNHDVDFREFLAGLAGLDGFGRDWKGWHNYVIM